MFTLESLIGSWTFLEKNRTYLLSAIGFLLLCAWGAHHYYSSSQRKEQAAYEAVAQLLSELDGAYQNPELWVEIENGAKTALMQFTNKPTRPYLQIIMAEALKEQNKIDDSYKLLDQAVAQLSLKSVFGGLFAAKAAALRLSSDQQAVREQGIALLEQLSRDSKNEHAAYATFLLAQYYDHAHENDKATPLYEQLAQSAKNKSEFELSPFAFIAQQRLAQGV
ncbi:MAG: hypothetical protein WCE21_00570 [Candidatus Babeliales bacterium]